MTTKISLRPLISLAILASLGGLPLPAAAQRQGEGPPPPAEIAKMQARETDDIALLLTLRPEQRPALTAFLQSTTPPPPPRGGPDGRAANGRAANGKGPDAAPSGDGFAQHLDRMALDAARHAAEDTRRITAARSFYEGLDPVQRRAFEALMRLRHGNGEHGPGGPGPHGFGRHGPNGPVPGGEGPGGEGPGGGSPRGAGSPPIDAMPPRP